MIKSIAILMSSSSSSSTVAYDYFMTKPYLVISHHHHHQADSGEAGDITTLLSSLPWFSITEWSINRQIIIDHSHSKFPK
jgi:hypothetical protein